MRHVVRARGIRLAWVWGGAVTSCPGGAGAAVGGGGPAWGAFLRRRGSDLHLAALVEAGREEAPARLRAQLRLLLRLMSNPLVNLLLTGRPKAVFRMSRGEAAAYLRSWG